ncbi:winged helix DNA-binding domain-containing protein [Demequina sp. TTPB684]|uniref:winged helix-turn-helix domain-containing protein n=1 Tax=unclassified Demequina TaxID=2620311 RepID=UPI001CF1F94B|nr:crosslink repair DNA glycosylase YcaQ family protein [Demequina sp. TMPB413]MCB2412967.1 winged helix DNA-binding domain-containing protein [Demequina sp. TTPB684]UPU88345.1 winged helix DNA-binding domain-containing protein [Demequina sp. TMPB413]
MTTVVSAAQARRVFLNAQGLARKRPSRAVRDRDFAAYLHTQGVLQLDTVNVLARAHYLPLYSRLGPYPLARAEAFLWGDADGHSAHAFEHWGHEASVMPRELLPALHHRMEEGTSWQVRAHDRLEAERPGLIDGVRALVEERGPLVGADVEHLAPREGRKGPWWDTSHSKDALDYLFITGKVAASRGRHFARTYDSTERAWGLPPADAADAGSSHPWGLSPADARQQLFDRALAACGIGTVADLCDHFRLPLRPGSRYPDAAGGEAWAASAVERGLAAWVNVEGWKDPALMAVGGPVESAPWHRAAMDPGRATGAALLSPFDPVCWFRPRLLRMFGMEYTIEIYTPAHKRVYGYYCLPFLLGDQMVARVDLKADRHASVLQVKAAWRERGTVPGARRRRDDEVATALVAELETMRGWLGLEAIAVESQGDLAPVLTQSLAL